MEFGNETYDINPTDPVLIACETVEFGFEHTDTGEDLFLLVVHDQVLGAAVVAMSAEQAEQTANHLAGMCRHADELRDEWVRKNIEGEGLDG
ncbi:hypothetical protein JDV09_18905 [Mycobacterium sp. Y57]|uniref:hypothetical protein n=1 Tax=Mycolicibacterium xanthum TaxID=2796469 RepID=UPI001C857390|nr:hypothetical protein [Mycolicibacterium xanthum]MBX7434169.1 hypothetical protein [Mycolicibacterium xanthum]